MANEVTLKTSSSAIKGGISNVSGEQSVVLTMGGIHHAHFSQTINTSETQLAIPANIIKPGYIHLKNRDATNGVRVGYATGVYKEYLPPGGILLASFDPSQTAVTVYLLALNSACTVECRTSDFAAPP